MSGTDNDSSREPLEALAEEFVERRRRGERPSIDEYTDKHPQLAAEIREMFPALVKVEQLKPGAMDVTGGGEEEVGAHETPPKQIGDYRILREVGRGGMGIVYEADQQSLGRHVALKVLRSNFLVNAKHVSRFRREAQAGARLHHTNIVPVFGVGQEGDVHYYVMQFIQGQPLDDVVEELKWLRDSSGLSALRQSDHDRPKGSEPAHDLKSREVALGMLSGQFGRRELVEPGSAPQQRQGEAAAEPEPESPPAGTEAESGSSGSSFSAVLPGDTQLTSTTYSDRNYWQSVARIGRQVADALDYSHAQGILHRDIKPSNVMLDAHGTVWVTDFGLAKVAEQEGLTQTGDIVGTLRYMAPESFHGKADARTDIRGLGLTLYELITLRPAFDDADRSQLIRHITTGEITRLGKINPSVPRDLETIVMKAVGHEPADRYQTAGELTVDLRRFLHDEPIRARRVSLPERFTRWCRRNPVVAGLATAVTVLLVAVTVVSIVAAVRFENLAAEKEQARGKAEAERKETRRLLYVSDMNVAQQAWDAANVGRVLELLDRHRPEPDREDLRGFEWYYIWRLCQRSLMTPTIEHGSCVNAVALSPDGRTLASGCNDMTVRLWDVATGQLQETLTGHTNRVYAVVFSPDGRTLASGGWDNTVKLWNVATGEELDSLSRAGCTSVAFSPDGRTLAFGSAADTVKLWSVATGELLHDLAGHTNHVWSVAFSPDGRTLASGSLDKTVMLWDVTTGQYRGSLPGHTVVRSVAFSPDGKTLAWGSIDGTVKLSDVANHEELHSLISHQDAVESLTFSPDGQTLASGAFDNTVKLWDVTTGELEDTFIGHAAPVQSVMFFPQATRLASGSEDGTVKLWDVVAHKQPNILKGHTGGVVSLAFSRHGTLASGSWDNTARLWDVTTGELKATLKGHTDWVNAVAFFPDGKTLASGSTDRTIKLWNVTTAQLRDTLNAEKLNAEKRVCSLACSPDGKTLALGTWGRIQLWNVTTGDLGDALTGHKGPASSLAFSPDGRTLASGGRDGTVRLWNMATGDELHILEGHTEDVRGLAFSPDGKTLASASEDATVKLWEVAKAELISTLKGHGGRVFSVAFSPDGKALASSSADRTVKLWDIATGQQRATLTGHTRGVPSVAFAPHGKILASGGFESTIRLWRAATEEEVCKATTLLTLEKRVRTIATADAQKRQQILTDVRTYLAAKVAEGLVQKDFFLATSTARALEESGHYKLASEAYRTFADVIAKSKDEKVSDVAKRWEGIARRLVQQESVE